MGEALGVYLTGKLSRPTGSWKAVWRTVPDVLLEDCDYGELEFVGVLVEVKGFHPNPFNLFLGGNSMHLIVIYYFVD